MLDTMFSTFSDTYVNTCASVFQLCANCCLQRLSILHKAAVFYFETDGIEQFSLLFPKYIGRKYLSLTDVVDPGSDCTFRAI